MKVLIVEDEIHAREALELLIDWDQYAVSEIIFAGDGEEALHMIEQDAPDIMFCDMRMPKMDGVELLDTIENRGYDIKIIVISGYDDFRYTHAAIKAHGVDYILKPLKKNEVQDAFNKAVALCEADRSRKIAEKESEKRIEEADRVLSEQKLYRWLTGDKIRTADVLRTFEKLGLRNYNVRVDVILPRNATHVLHQLFSGDNEMFVFEINNVAREVFKTYPYVHVFCIDHLQWILISSTGGMSIPEAGHDQIIRRLTKAWEDDLGITVFIASGDTDIQIVDIPGQVRQIRLKLLKCELLNAAGDAKPEGMPLSFIDQELLLSHAIHDRNVTFLTQVIQSFCKKLRERHSLKLEELQIYTTEANLMIRRFALKLEHPFVQYHDPVSLWINDIELWQETLIDSFCQLMDGDGICPEHSADKIREYIYQHYNEQISLSQLSEQFFLSPQYISKIYRERFGKTIITEVTELRMENAKLMLVNTDKPVLEIALFLGFNDENYFGKVFKKHIGMSPNTYRNHTR